MSERRCVFNGQHHIDDATIDSIKLVLDYMWDDEFKDYQEQDEEGQENHILNALTCLDDYVNNLDEEER